MRCPVSWYLASYGDHGTHRGAVTDGGAVRALCGVTFDPIRLFGATAALTGQPSDPDQVCPECLRKVSDR